MNANLKKSIIGVIAITSILSNVLGCGLYANAEEYTDNSDSFQYMAVTSSNSISISGNAKIPDIKKGKTASVSGTLTSTSKITSVTVGVYDNSNKRVTGITVSPNSTTYNLKNADRYVYFNTLPVGNYHYIIIASNETDSDLILVNQSFSVTDGSTTNDAITISGNSKISDLKKGKTASVTGTLTSKSKMTSVTVGVYDSNNKLVTGKTVQVNATTYNLKNLDKYVYFNTLPVGNYHYIVKASNSTNSNLTVVDQTFSVTDGSTTNDAITISGNSKISDLKKGKTASVTGTLTSKSKMTSVTVGVYDNNNKLITGKTVQVNATTYNLKNLDKYVYFNTLPVGNYHYIVKASNSTNSNLTVVDQTFSVTDGSTTNDAIAISGNTKISDLKKGKTASVTGTLTSKSKMTSVTVGVYDSNNKLITGKTVQVNATTYNLKNLDNYVYFNTLPVGNYHYIVKATNSTNMDYIVINQAFSVS